MCLNSSPELYLDQTTAISTLSKALKSGYLSLFLGAGVSRSATEAFPDWVSLVKRCCETKGIPFEDDSKESNDYLRKIMESVERKCVSDDFIKLVESNLYMGVTYDKRLMKTDLLVSLGSLVMTSVRGGARAVVNYNFDDLIEWYLGYHGFTLEVVSMLPTLTSKVDVQIYHPHGFIPKLDKYLDKKTRHLIATEKAYQLEICSEVSPWNELQRSIICSTLCLFVGLSGDDPHIDSICTKVYEKLIEKKRILGFIILLDNKKNRKNEDHSLARGLVPIYIKSHNDLPDFLLNICQAAAEI